MPGWDPDVYLKFANERTPPTIDLIERIHVADPRRIIDLGCGPGNSTEQLRRRWPQSTIVGLDSSADMIAKARQSYPDATWIAADAGAWKADEPFDLVFSNAMLHWLPDHARLCRRSSSRWRRAGRSPYRCRRTTIRRCITKSPQVSHDPAWNGRMERARRALTKEPPAFYFDVLEPLAKHVDLWDTVYYHVVSGPEAVVDWFRGTGLRPFLEALSSEEERLRFETLLLERYREAYPRRPSGHVLFPFKRLFFVAYR